MRRLTALTNVGEAGQFGWDLVAEADSPRDLDSVTSDLELEVGQGVRAEVHLSIPVAGLIDIVGINYLGVATWQQVMNPVDVRVERVFAQDSHTIVMEGTVTGTPLVIILGAIAALLFAASAVIVSIRFLVSPQLLPDLNQFLENIEVLAPVALIAVGGVLVLWPRGGA